MYIANLKRGEGWKVMEKVQLISVWVVQEKDEDVQEQKEYQQSGSIYHGVFIVEEANLDHNLIKDDVILIEVNGKVLQI